MGDSFVEIGVIYTLLRSQSCRGIPAQEVGNTVHERLGYSSVEQFTEIERHILDDQDYQRQSQK